MAENKFLGQLLTLLCIS